MACSPKYSNKSAQPERVGNSEQSCRMIAFRYTKTNAESQNQQVKVCEYKEGPICCAWRQIISARRRRDRDIANRSVIRILSRAARCDFVCGASSRDQFNYSTPQHANECNLSCLPAPRCLRVTSHQTQYKP